MEGKEEDKRKEGTKGGKRRTWVGKKNEKGMKKMRE